MTLSTGILLTISVAFCFAVAIGSRFAGKDILARGNPNLLDLVVALAAVEAGAFALTRRQVSCALAGVAIAVALVPTLCVVGIGLGLRERFSAAHIASLGQYSLTRGALLLFATNLVAITISGALIYFLGAYSSLKDARVGIVIALVCMLALVIPLNTLLQAMVWENYAKSEVYQAAFKNFPD